MFKVVLCNCSNLLCEIISLSEECVLLSMKASAQAMYNDEHDMPCICDSLL